jgi:hypothetical protein
MNFRRNPTSAGLPPFRRRGQCQIFNDDVTVHSPSRLFSSRGWVTGRVNKDYLSKIETDGEVRGDKKRGVLVEPYAYNSRCRL